MAVKRYKYGSNSGGVYRIRMDEAKKAITGNDEPTGAVTDPNVEVIVSNKGRKRKAGIAPRGAIFFRTITGGTGAGAVSKNVYVFIPALTTASLTAISGGTDITYKGQTYQFLSTVPEV